MPPKVEIVSVCRIQADNAVALVILCLVVHCVCAHVAFCVHACVYACAGGCADFIHWQATACTHNCSRQVLLRRLNRSVCAPCLLNREEYACLVWLQLGWE